MLAVAKGSLVMPRRRSPVLRPPLAPLLAPGTPLRSAPVSLTASGTVAEAAPAEAAESCPTAEVRSLELFKFVVPTLGGWISSEMMSVIDTAIVGGVSANDLAALGPATMLTDSAAYVFFWLNVATTSLFATSLAAKKPNEAYDTLSDALWCALACGIGMTLLMATFGRSALVAICSGGASAVVPAANSYLKIRLLGLPAFMCGMVLQAACLGARDSISPLLVLVASAAIK